MKLLNQKFLKIQICKYTNSEISKKWSNDLSGTNVYKTLELADNIC